jgi:large-conductance mechanosensitive channel
MILRSTKDGSIVLISIFAYALIVAFWPRPVGGGQLSTALACVIHAALFILLAYRFSRYCSDPRFLKTPLALSCLLLIIYLGVPFIKYYGEPRYVELDVALHYRLFGLVVISASIFLILQLYTKTWIRLYRRSKEVERSVRPLLVPLMYTVLGVTTFYLVTGGIFTGDSLTPAQVTFIVSGYYIALFYFALFGNQKRAFLNEILFVCGGIAVTYGSGQRFGLMLSIFVLVFARLSRIQSSKKRQSVILMSILATPLAIMMLLVPLTEMTKTRYGGVSLLFELQRTDFSDFVGAAAAADYKENVVTALHTSVLWAIPGGLIDKEKLDWSMEPFFKKNNWRSSDYREGYNKWNIDYIDSIFSSGAMVGGFVGALLLSLAWYGVFTALLSQLKSTLLLSFYLASIPSMLRIEIAFWTIVPTLRNWVVISLILFVVIQPIFWLRRRRRQNIHRKSAPGVRSA